MNPWIEITGWTLIHFVWQGTLLTLATAAALGLCRRASAQVRYVVACLGLAAMLVTAAATAVIARAPAGDISFSADRVSPADPFVSPQAHQSDPPGCRSPRARRFVELQTRGSSCQSSCGSGWWG